MEGFKEVEKGKKRASVLLSIGVRHKFFLTILFESQLSFLPLLSFSLWSKQESHFLSFSRGILVEAF